MDWNAAQGELSLHRVAHYYSALPTLNLRPVAGHWEQTASQTAASPTASLLAGGNIAVEVRQSLNTPPDVFATDVSSSRTRKLTTLNPQFADLEFGKAKVIEWDDTRGHHHWTAGLVYPTHYQAGKRYPLVIQTHGFSPKEFLMDGPFQMYTGVAAQALANRGFLVLQMNLLPMNETWDNWITSEHEGPFWVEAFESAVSHLSSLGLIDPRRVGLEGFSRTCYHVKYELAFGHLHIAAAAVSDGVDFGYIQAITGSAYAYAPVYNGALPVGEGLKRYLQSAPTFQADHIDTPLRLEAIADRVSGEWEMYSLLQMRGVPTEMFYYPDGLHELQKPREQLHSQEGNTDWFDYWINGHEDPSPDKKSQYDRWDRLKHERQAERNHA
jgi:dipeptidyl aminopeptidase/acylaminoacyl peptidase